MASLLKRVQSKMFIFAHRKTLGLLDGEYGSVFKGRSLDFDELRAYTPGDEVRDIDWKATARHGSPLVKRYVAIRRQTVLLVTDTGRNMSALAVSGEAKRDIAVQALGVLGYLAHRHGDVVGLVHGTAVGSSTIPPRSGEDHLERLLQEVHRSTTLDGGPSGIGRQLDDVLRTFKRRMLVVVVADEVMPDAGTELLLRRLQARHELLWFTVRDAELAASNPADAFDVADGSGIPAALAGNAAVRAAYHQASREREQRRQDLFRRLGIAEGRAGSSTEVVAALFAMLERHRSRPPHSTGGRAAGRGQQRAG
ncbi:hypothetical protein BIU82_14090 [Arthrobacter sp. SW1]|uniref:DUF58 domain-containing protein n=1 Tax=Arthrobacter sp. SW1 TaxID=1920889 RepID=UPI000877BAA9|nr:DUF58 domain-containing protein [Arthrobacter sp. SW1]OFI39454.1 hypothetical protein BIU82_14090 [Arthrobacter sp. SW1]